MKAYTKRFTRRWSVLKFYSVRGKDSRACTGRGGKPCIGSFELLQIVDPYDANAGSPTDGLDHCREPYLRGSLTKLLIRFNEIISGCRQASLFHAGARGMLIACRVYSVRRVARQA
jgi:hypothetical protein